MIPIIVVLGLAIAALTVLIVLDASGLLYGDPPKEDEEVYEYLFDDSLELLDGVIHETEEYQYRLLADGTAELYFYKDVRANSVTVPSEIEGYKVTVIGTQCFVQLPSLSTVVIPDGVVGIGDEAFADCGNLYNLRLPESIKVIGTKAFSGCLAAMNVDYSGDISTVNVGAGNSYLVSSIGRAKR